MTNFEKITASPEALGAFLASLPVAAGPWDEEFKKVFCAECKRKDCDSPPCLHRGKRNNPLWWLMQEETQSKAESLLTRILKIYNDYTAAMEEVKRLNAEALEKQERETD